MEELITVIVPVYNVEQYLESCVKSIQNQSYKNLEIILVNDGATDGSKQLCERLGQEDERIIVLNKKNGGLSDARNAGMKIMHGKYLMFVDGDDIIAEDMVKHLYWLIKKDNTDMSICNLLHCYPGKEKKFITEDKEEILDKKEVLCKMWYQDEILMSACGKLYSKTIFENIEFPKGMLYEDVAIMYKLVWNCKKISYTTAALYGYMHRENSITTKKFDKRDMDILKICDSIVQFSKGKGENVVKAATAYYVVGKFRIYLNAPRNGIYDEVLDECKDDILKYMDSVLKDKCVRKKLKYALILFKYFRPFISMIYKRVDRWR